MNSFPICLRSQLHLHPFRALTPSPTFHFPPFMPFTIYAFYTISYLVVLILFLFNLSHVLLTLCIRTHPNFTTTASSSTHFPPLVITYNRYSTGIRIPFKNINILYLPLTLLYLQKQFVCCNSVHQSYHHSHYSHHISTLHQGSFHLHM